MAGTGSTRATCASATSRRTTPVRRRARCCLVLMEWRRCRWTRQRCRRAISSRCRLLRILLEDIARLVGEPVEQVARLPEAAVVRRGAEDDDSDVVIAFGQSEERREAVAGLADEAGLPTHHFDLTAAHEPVGAVNRERAPVGGHLVLGGPHDRRDPI